MLTCIFLLQKFVKPNNLNKRPRDPAGRRREGGDMVEKEKPPKVTLTLRLPRALYEELKEEAECRGLSLHEYILVKLNPLVVEFERE